ncbi:MAG: hypothetical protein Q9187_005803 [Circinaria calcarea]
MADPLSGIASVVTILDTGAKCAKHLRRLVQDFRHADDELTALSNETNDLNVVLTEVERAGHAIKNAGNLPQTQVIDALSTQLDRARRKLTELESLTKLLLPPGSIKADKIAWIRKKATARRLQVDLRDVRQSLHALLDTTTAAGSVRIELSLGALQTTSTQHQNTLLSRFDHASNEQEIQRTALEQLIQQSFTHIQTELSQHRQDTSIMLDQVSAQVMENNLLLNREPRRAASVELDAENADQMAQVGNSVGIKSLLESRKGSPNDVEIDNGSTALTVRNLLRSHNQDAVDASFTGADSHIEDNRGFSPIQLAGLSIVAKRGTPQRLRKLEEFFPLSAAIEEWEFQHVHKIVLGILSLNLEAELQKPIHRSEIDATDSKGQTALHWAVQRPDDTAVQLLLQNGANPTARRGDERTPLHLSGSLRCTELLLMAGADVHAADMFGDQVLHRACYSYHHDLAIVKALVMAGASVSSRNSHGFSVLSYSIQAKTCPIVAFLIQQGANINEVDPDGDTPLFNALIDGNSECIELLLSEGADYRTINKAGDTVLHITAIFGGARSIQVLIRAALRGVDTEAKDLKGRTARQALDQRHSIPEGFVEAFEELLRRVQEANESPIVEEVDEAEEDEFVEALESQDVDIST